ncbi:MAG TPA: aminotransferase class I/II-fold pyridoxal phosphate-dependent enzyme, partial [Chthonomonadales bacterium]|nr:aminotransferase class I/II-fold pyridoxal phosphate-dependent enzyme [Chthonomonadales bacterium]
AEAARCFSSGMAAISAAVLHSVRAGDHIVAVKTIYGPSQALLSQYISRFEVSVTFVPGIDPQQFADALRPNTKLIYLESPSSLVFHLQDIAAVTALAHERGLLTLVDNSWASPYFQNPIELGADLVVHSATKYLGGHSDLIAGVLMGSKVHIDSIKDNEGALLGGVLDPFASWLLLRGLRTLPIRMERHQTNALAIARYLEAHPKVARVYYPGLPSHPQYALGRRQMRGFSGLMSFVLKDGGKEAVFAMVNRLHYFHIACSWGGYESLVYPLTLPAEENGRQQWGARIHVGLETVDDLLEDLENALG